MTIPIDGTTPLWIAAGKLLNERSDDFFRHCEKASETFDPEEIHDLRVSSRRLREGLSLFSACYPAGEILPLLKRVKRVTRMTGDIRNTDEALLFFTALADQLDETCRRDLAKLLNIFRKKRNKGIRELNSGLPEVVPLSLHREYRRVVSAPLLFRVTEQGVDLLAPLATFARTALAGRLAEVVALTPAAENPGASGAQHLLRIAIKRWRYRMEILSFLLGAPYGKIHTAAKNYQEVLGKMHDLDVFAGIMADADFSSRSKNRISDSIQEKRDSLFTDFSALLANVPPERIGDQVENALRKNCTGFPVLALPGI